LALAFIGDLHTVRMSVALLTLLGDRMLGGDPEIA
jgi:hypothetical protein